MYVPYSNETKLPLCWKWMIYLDLFYPLDDLGYQDISKEPIIQEQLQVGNHDVNFPIKLP